MPGETGYVVIDPDVAKQSRTDLGVATPPGTPTSGTASTSRTTPTGDLTTDLTTGDLTTGESKKKET